MTRRIRWEHLEKTLPLKVASSHVSRWDKADFHKHGEDVTGELEEE